MDRLDKEGAKVCLVHRSQRRAGHLALSGLELCYACRVAMPCHAHHFYGASEETILEEAHVNSLTGNGCREWRRNKRMQWQQRSPSPGQALQRPCFLLEVTDTVTQPSLVECEAETCLLAYTALLACSLYTVVGLKPGKSEWPV